MQCHLFLLFLVAGSFSARVQYLKRAGEQVELSLSGDIKTWTRVRMDGREEFIRFCVNGQHSPYCTHFVSQSDLKISDPPTEAKVYPNGTLIIPLLKTTDAGFYSSHDEPENIHRSEDGNSMWGTPRTQIVVTVEE